MKESISMKSVQSDKNKDEEEINFIYKLSKDVNEIGEYLAGKIKFMDGQIMNINDKLDEYKVELSKKGEQLEDRKFK